jgi:hypothetical protein
MLFWREVGALKYIPILRNAEVENFMKHFCQTAIFSIKQQFTILESRDFIPTEII